MITERGGLARIHHEQKIQLVLPRSGWRHRLMRPIEAQPSGWIVASICCGQGLRGRIGRSPRRRDAFAGLATRVLMGHPTANAWLLTALGIDTVQAAAGFGLTVGMGYRPCDLIHRDHPTRPPRPFFYTALNATFFIGGCVSSCVVLL